MKGHIRERSSGHWVIVLDVWQNVEHFLDKWLAYMASQVSPVER